MRAPVNALVHHGADEFSMLVMRSQARAAAFTDYSRMLSNKT
jgi:hypothetical protein